MKSTSIALAAQIAGPVTTLATCWRITRMDGAEFFFTDHGQPGVARHGVDVSSPWVTN